MIYDHTCALPKNDWAAVNIDAPACADFAPETLDTPADNEKEN